MKAVVIVLTFLSFGCLAQSDNYAVGEWEMHAPYNRAKSIALLDDRAYAASEDGLFYYEREDQSVKKLSKIEGLNDTEISFIEYHDGTDQVLLGYQSGNIDIIQGNTIFNLNEIARSNIIGSKKINHILPQGDLAYLSTDFGVVVLDMEKREVKESYKNIGVNGEQLEVRSAAIVESKDSIYLRTNKGIWGSSLLDNVNRLDFNNWREITDNSNNTINNVTGIAALNDTLYFFINWSGLHYLDGDSIHRADVSVSPADVKSMKTSKGKLVICTKSNIALVSHSKKSSTQYDPSYDIPWEAELDDRGRLWVVTNNNGLVTNGDTEEFGYRQIYPNGPSSIRVFRLYGHDDKVFAVSGGYNNSFAPRYFDTGWYVYSEFNWENFKLGWGKIPNMRDIVDVTYNPVNKRYYFGSYGRGLLIYDTESEEYSTINDTTVIVVGTDSFPSPLSNACDKGFCPVVDGEWPGNHTRVSSVEVDDEGNIWLTNHQNTGLGPIHKIALDGSWETFSLQNSAGNWPIDLIIDDNGFKWVLIGGDGGKSGIIAFNDVTGEERYLTSSIGNGGLPTSKTTAYALDRNQELWVGTTEGVAVFQNTSEVFTATSYDAVLPIFESRPLLQDEEITCITIDGGNRKWIGSTNGLWLFDENTSEELINFNTDNSPIPSNNILDIGINEATGEVLIGTEKGIISYWGSATEGEDICADVKVFPNPARPDFDGTVGITGLAGNANIKITDISGSLVFETDAEGGMAVWDMKDLNGNSAQSGVYLLLASDETAENTCSTKIAVVE